MSGILDSSGRGWKLFFIVLGGIAAIAVTAALAGCITSKCYHMLQRRRRLTEKSTLATAIATEASRSNSPAPDIVGVQDDIIEARGKALLAQNVYFGRELEDYRQKTWKKGSSAVMLPVLLSELARWARRSLSAEEDLTIHTQSSEHDVEAQNCPSRSQEKQGSSQT